ncbi:MAG: cyclase family protein [Chloroflexi bacterium]|nr:cyclase family protein [Chloroflexota bacterium]
MAERLGLWPGDEWWPSRYGPEDELGAANELTPDRLLRALQIPRRGVKYNLALTIGNRLPLQSMHGPIVHYTYRTHEQGADFLQRVPGGNANESGCFTDRAELPLQAGTHIDALNHVSIGDRMYNGFPATQSRQSAGTERLGIDRCPPIVTRGVLLDVAAVQGVVVLDSGYVVTPADLEAASARQGLTEPGPGDAVLLHTGWLKAQFHRGREYLLTEPGIGMAAATWLTDRRVALVGADNFAVEVIPTELPGLPMPVHQHFLVQHGTFLMEHVVVDDLVRDRVFEFLFVAVPLRVAGGSGSAITPVAIA